MSVWADVDRLTKASQEAFAGAQARLKAIGYHHMSVSEYGVWRAKHPLHGWVTATNGEDLVKAATRALVRERK